MNSEKKDVEWKNSGTYQVAFVFIMWEIEWHMLEKDFQEYIAEVVKVMWWHEKAHET